MLHLHRPFTLVLAISIALASSVVSHAAVLVSANAEGLPGGYTTPTQTASGGTVSDSAAGSSSAGSIVGRAEATHGLLRAYAESNAPAAGNPLATIFVGATALFKDNVTIDAPALFGTQGTLTVKFTIDGTLSSTDLVTRTNPTNLNSAEAEFNFYRDNSTINSGDYVVYSDGTSSGSNFLGIEQTASFSFTYGTPFEIYLKIYARTGGYAEFGTVSIADLEHTATWGGFDAVKDAGGNTITNFSTTSTSGTNYSQPVPEPGSTAIFLGGLALCATLRRRRTA